MNLKERILGKPRDLELEWLVYKHEAKKLAAKTQKQLADQRRRGEVQR